MLRDKASSAAVRSTDGHATHNGGSSGTKMPAELSATQKQLDVQRGRCRSLQGELRYCTGQLSAERYRCMELENRLADKTVDIEVLQKRLQEVRTPRSAYARANDLSADPPSARYRTACPDNEHPLCTRAAVHLHSHAPEQPSTCIAMHPSSRPPA